MKKNDIDNIRNGNGNEANAENVVDFKPRAANERRTKESAANEGTNQRTKKQTKAAANERTAKEPAKELQKPDGEIVKRKRGGKTASIADNTTARPEEIARAVRNAFQYFNRNIVKSDEECAERINGYFRDCADQQMLPTVENLSLALGTVRRTVWDWEQGIGCSVARTNMIKKAKQILASIDAELVSSGKIPQVVYIFRAKNFYQMSDQQEIMINAGGTGEQDMSADEIAKRYLEDGKTVEAELVEDSNMDG